MRAVALAALVAALAFAAEVGAAEPSVSLPDIEDEVMCPICGTLLGLSESPQAERERVFIRRLISEGRSKDEILDALVAEYGPEVLATPDTEGFDLVAWIAPGAAILLAGGALVVGLRRWRDGGDDDAGPGAEADADAERLDADLARYGA